jgi:flagellar biosynthesis GTPase FlhF
MQEPKTNIYLKTWPNRTTMQVFNILRSKLTYEAMLLKSRGATQSWHERARPFHDGTVNIRRLAEFAQEHLGLPIGNPEYENSGGDYPNDPLLTHDGLTKWDYCRKIWILKRKLSFDVKGILIVKPMQSRARKEGAIDEKKKVSEEVSKKKKEKMDERVDKPAIEDATDTDAVEPSLRLTDDEEEEAEIERAARRAAKEATAANTKRRQTMHEREMQSERDSLRDENKQLKKGIRTADNKLDIAWTGRSYLSSKERLRPAINRATSSARPRWATATPTTK